MACVVSHTWQPEPVPDGPIRWFADRQPHADTVDRGRQRLVATLFLCSSSELPVGRSILECLEERNGSVDRPELGLDPVAIRESDQNLEALETLRFCGGGPLVEC